MGNKDKFQRNFQKRTSSKQRGLGICTTCQEKDGGHASYCPDSPERKKKERKKFLASKKANKKKPAMKSVAKKPTKQKVKKKPARKETKQQTKPACKRMKSERMKR